MVLERQGRRGVPTVLLELVRPAPDAPTPDATDEPVLPGMPSRMGFQLAVLTRVLSGQETSVFPHGEPAAIQRGVALLRAAEAVMELQCWLDATVVHLAREMAERAGAELLAREGHVNPQDLSRTRRERWRQQTKSLVANELQALTGRGIQDCHDLVGLALAPAASTGVVLSAMEGGRADWVRASRWWKRCRRMSVEDAARVARALFAPTEGADARDDEADGDDTATGTSAARMSMAEFARDLDREATRVEGRDAAAARRRRSEAVQARCAWALFEEEGVGSFSVTGRTSTVAAAMDRVDAIARRARAGGDSRTLDQLRSDATLALLTHGVLPAHDYRPSGTTGARVGEDTSEGRTPDPPDEELDPAAGGGWMPADVDRLSAVLEGHVPAAVEVVVPLDVLLGADPDGVGEIVGRGFITGEHARELLGVPGSTLRRLVTDPVTGTAIERSVDRYRPDRAMRDHVTAVDQHCRGPGCTTPARLCELDHVREYPDGPTAVANLTSVHRRHHAMKTNGWWSAVLAPDSRRLRWTTFFGRIHVTEPHDYGQYPGSSQSDVRESPGADLRDRLCYAALAHRETVPYLADYDDEAPDDDHCAGRSAAFRDRTAPVFLRHRTAGGAVRRGAPPGQPHPADLLTAIKEVSESDVPVDRDSSDLTEAAPTLPPPPPPPPF